MNIMFTYILLIVQILTLIINWLWYRRVSKIVLKLDIDAKNKRNLLYGAKTFHNMVTLVFSISILIIEMINITGGIK